MLPTWKRSETTRQGSSGKTVHEITWRDPRSGLECCLELSSFSGYRALEWIIRFRNGGRVDTPILADVNALDLDWTASGETALFRSRGSESTIADFEYLRESLDDGGVIRMAAGGGRSSNNWLPIFNLQSGNISGFGHEGIITAIGWTGQWAAEFSRPQVGMARIRAGMERTHLRLHPGEEIRSPRMLLLFWSGERMDSHNRLRRFLLEHHTPRPEGRLLQAPLTAIHWGGMKTKEHLKRIAVYRRARVAYDYYWVDAGWYGPADSYSPDEHTGDWGKHTGNWNSNPKAHPRGLRPIAEGAQTAGMKFLLWYEPERAVVGTPWTMEHPGYFLGERKLLGNLLLNLGNPEARRFLTDYLLESFEQNQVSCYRQDFNFDPLPYWRDNDAPDRQGISEIRYVEGLYTFWDELLERRPGLIIDNCASGGRRIDLETISRSVPLSSAGHRSCTSRRHGTSSFRNASRFGTLVVATARRVCGVLVTRSIAIAI